MAKYIELMPTSVTEELDKRNIELGKLLLAFFALYLRQQHSREKKEGNHALLCTIALFFKHWHLFLSCMQPEITYQFCFLREIKEQKENEDSQLQILEDELAKMICKDKKKR